MPGALRRRRGAARKTNRRVGSRSDVTALAGYANPPEQLQSDHGRQVTSTERMARLCFGTTGRGRPVSRLRRPLTSNKRGLILDFRATVLLQRSPTIMIIWQGFGFLVAVVGIASLVLTEYAVREITKNEVYYQTHGWPKLVGLWLAAIATFLIARYFDSRPGKVVIEKDTGREIVLRQSHSLFFVPMKYWAYVFLVLGVVFLFVR